MNKTKPYKIIEAVALILLAASIGIALAAMLSLIAKPAAAAEAQYVIATGKAGGGYDRRAQDMAERLKQRQMLTDVINLNGSDEISLAVCGKRAQIGIMQIDAIYARSLEGCTMKPVGVYGEEVAVILFPPKSDMDELSDLTAQSAVMVDTIGSGSDLFWNTIVRIETGDDGSGDEWAKARVVNDPLELAVASATMGDVQALVLVRKPDSPDITRLLELGWTMGELWDKDVNDLQFRGAELYESAKIDIRYGASKARDYGYVVRSFIVVGNDVANGDRNAYAAIVKAAQ